ncbi:MAG: hypothetical protein R3A80_12815 [Bdellovibrionota bacterium]
MLCFVALGLREAQATLSSAATQQMSRAAINPDITRPINKASVLVDRTMPPVAPKTPTQSRTTPYGQQEKSSLTQKDLTENL